MQTDLTGMGFHISIEFFASVERMTTYTTLEHLHNHCFRMFNSAVSQESVAVDEITLAQFTMMGTFLC